MSSMSMRSPSFRLTAAQSSIFTPPGLSIKIPNTHLPLSSRQVTSTSSIESSSSAGLMICSILASIAFWSIFNSLPNYGRQVLKKVKRALYKKKRAGPTFFQEAKKYIILNRYEKKIKRNRCLY